MPAPRGILAGTRSRIPLPEMSRTLACIVDAPTWPSTVIVTSCLILSRGSFLRSTRFLSARNARFGVRLDFWSLSFSDQLTVEQVQLHQRRMCLRNLDAHRVGSFHGLAPADFAQDQRIPALDFDCCAAGECHRHTQLHSAARDI